MDNVRMPGEERDHATYTAAQVHRARTRICALATASAAINAADDAAALMDALGIGVNQLIHVTGQCGQCNATMARKMLVGHIRDTAVGLCEVCRYPQDDTGVRPTPPRP